MRRWRADTAAVAGVTIRPLLSCVRQAATSGTLCQGLLQGMEAGRHDLLLVHAAHAQASSHNHFHCADLFS